MVGSQKFFTFIGPGKGKGIVLLNILGLSLGIWCSLMIALWIRGELGWNGFHDNGNRIYQVMSNVQVDKDTIITWHGLGYPVGEQLAKSVPDLEAVVRISEPQTTYVSVGDTSGQWQVLGADPNFFEVFTFPMVEGAFTERKTETKTVVLSQALANSYFPDGKAIGRSILLTLGDQEEAYDVTGVFRNVPSKSTLQFDAVVSLDNFLPLYNESWGNAWTKTFVLLGQSASRLAVQEAIRDIPERYGGSDWFTLYLHPLKSLHLYTEFKNGQPVGGKIIYIWIFAVMGMVILLLVCWNYIGLATAGSFNGYKGIGIRKMIGAGRRRLIFGFFKETFGQVAIAMVLAVILAEFTLPFFNSITSHELDIDLYEPNFYKLWLGIGLIVLLLSGIYPAVLLSAFNPIMVLRRTFHNTTGRSPLRKALLTAQIGLGLVLIVGVATIFQQLEFIKGKNLGFQANNRVYVPLDQESSDHAEKILETLKKSPFISAVGRASNDFSSGMITTSDPHWEGRDYAKGKPMFAILDVDFELLQMMDISLASGRYFAKEHAKDTINYMVNQAAAELLGLEDPLDKGLSFWGEQGGRIVGVVRNFHFNSLYHPIQPLIIRCRPSRTDTVFIQVCPGASKEALGYLKQVHQRFSKLPFTYHFLGGSIAKNYVGEQKVVKLGAVCTLLVLVILYLGIVGLTIHVANVRIKEIAVRKILGARVLSLFVLLSKDFLKPILVAMLIAIPIAQFLVHQWMERFVFHIATGYWNFAAAVMIVLSIIFLTITTQSFKIVRMSAARSLRVE